MDIAISNEPRWNHIINEEIESEDIENILELQSINSSEDLNNKPSLVLPVISELPIELSDKVLKVNCVVIDGKCLETEKC